MKLNPDQQKKLIAKLQQTGWAEICSVCKDSNWNISDTIFELREFQSGGLVIGGGRPIYPVIPMACSRCGNTIFLNAVITGVLEPKPAEQGGVK
jgi:hypothetical protein